jgi:glycosyltransferase involved in cell wall biosynthesis/GT2 family glycosyltransferase
MRICFVSTELLGLHKNGGIGTATSHLAILLARRGHEITLLYVGREFMDPRDPWIKRYQSHGIKLVRTNGERLDVWPQWLRESSAVYQYIIDAGFDLVVFPDWEGHGYASCVGKKTGLALRETRLAIIAHGPTEWLLEANRTVAREQIRLAQIHMERLCFAFADVVVSPSAYLLGWLRAHHYELPQQACIPLFLWAEEELGATLPQGSDLTAVRKLAYFGRLEERKGIRLFLEAIVSPALALADFEVHFVGRDATMTAADVRAFVDERAPGLGPRLHFHSGFATEEAQQFLIDNECLAVIPSLTDNSPCVIAECIKRRIPFIATNVGGIPELVDRDDHERLLFAPTAAALVRRLKALLGEGEPFRVAKPGVERETVERQWLGWLEQFEQVPAGPTCLAASNPPPLDVIVVHYERPALLEQNLTALAGQTCTDFSLTVVDDGSRSAEATAYLDKVERQRWPFPVTVLRQQNAYLGAARNAGLRATRGDRVIFMDDDNIAFPTMVEQFVTAMDHSGADIITCQMAIFRDREGEPDLALLPSGERWAFTAGPTELGLSVNCYGGATGVYRRAAFDKAGMFHEWRGIGHEDWHFYVRAALAGLKLLSLPVPLFWYRRTAEGMLSSTDAYENNKIIWDVYKAHVGRDLQHLIDFAIRNTLVGDS